MTISKLDLLDISNENHIEKIKKYEQETNLSIDLSIVNTNSYEITTYIFSSKEEKINNIGLIQCQKDIKVATISPLGNVSKNFLSDITNYLLNNIGMESVFIKINKENKKTKKILEEKEYESLGEEGDNIIFLKEKETDIVRKRSL